MQFPKDLIRSARIRLGLTQAQAADRCGIPLRSYTAYEWGERQPPWGVGTNILQRLGWYCHIAYLGHGADKIIIKPDPNTPFGRDDDHVFGRITPYRFRDLVRRTPK